MGNPVTRRPPGAGPPRRDHGHRPRGKEPPGWPRRALVKRLATQAGPRSLKRVRMRVWLSLRGPDRTDGGGARPAGRCLERGRRQAGHQAALLAGSSPKKPVMHRNRTSGAEPADVTD